MNITVLGWYGHGNCGDESYKIAFPLLFASLDQNHNFRFVDNLWNLDLSDTDVIILGGGDIVKGEFIRKLTYAKSIRKDIPIIAASVTITPESDLQSLNIFDKIYVRDIRSLDIARAYHNHVKYLPDFSFILEFDPKRGRQIIQEKYDRESHSLTENFVVVVLNTYVSFNYKNALTKDTVNFMRVADELSTLSESMDTSWVFLPFSTKSPWDDRVVNGWVAERCKSKYNKNLCVYDKLSVQDTLDIISASKAVISSRFHSTIFSTLAGIPFVDILHHDKNLGFIEILGMLDKTTSLWHYEANKVTSLLNNFLMRDNQNDDYLKDFTTRAKEQLKNAIIL